MYKILDKYEDVMGEIFVALFAVVIIGMMFIMCLGFIPMYGLEMALMSCVLFTMLVYMTAYEVKKIKEAIDEVRAQ